MENEQKCIECGSELLGIATFERRCSTCENKRLEKAKVITETKQGTCEICGKQALLDKGNGIIWACENCFYKVGNQLPIKKEAV